MVSRVFFTRLLLLNEDSGKETFTDFQDTMVTFLIVTHLQAPSLGLCT